MIDDPVELEVIDLRTLKPYDAATIIASVKKTGRLIVVHEAPLIGGFGGEIAAMIAQSEAFAYLEAPIVRLGGADVPIPAHSPSLQGLIEDVRTAYGFNGETITSIKTLPHGDDVLLVVYGETDVPEILLAINDHIEQEV